MILTNKNFEKKLDVKIEGKEMGMSEKKKVLQKAIQKTKKTIETERKHRNGNFWKWGLQKRGHI